MAEAATKPSGRKRGRPRTVINDQEVPEVGQTLKPAAAPLKLTLISRDAANNFASHSKHIASEKKPRSITCRLVSENWKQASKISAILSFPSVISF